MNSIPVGCICAYTWNYLPPYVGLVRNSVVLSCPADHTVSEEKRS